MLSQLKPCYSSNKSFYNKAVIIEEGNKIILKSYKTNVAYIKHNHAYVILNKKGKKALYSNTTIKHVKDFLKQYGFKVESTNQIIKEYGI